MEDAVCLDSDFLINFLRNKKEEITFISENETKLRFATTFINLFELYYGAYRSNKEENIKNVENLFYKLEILNISIEAVKKAGKILVDLEKNGEAIDFKDLLIGCTALVEGYSIKTNNKKHFERIKDLKII